MNKEIREIFKDQIKTAKATADAEILKNPSDDGTCNFDKCLFKKENKWTYQEMIDLFKECGLDCSKHSSGWLSVDELRGQADKNTRWHKTFKYWMKNRVLNVLCIIRWIKYFGIRIILILIPIIK